MNYTELDEGDDNVYIDIHTKLDVLKTLPPCPEIEEISDDIQSDAASFQKLKTEYTQTIDHLYTTQKRFHDVVQKVNSLKSILETFSSSGKYVDDLSKVIEQFQEDENIDEIKNDIHETTKRFQMLRRVLNISDIGEEYMCFTCLQRKVDTFLYPCGHVMCNICSITIRDLCPFCRQTDIKKCKMFLG